MRKTNFVSLLIAALLVYAAQAQTTNGKFQSKIDDVKTADEIRKLLTSIDKKRFDTFTVNEQLIFESSPFSKDAETQCAPLTKDSNIKAWTKTDFDGNGYTDLLVHGNDFDPRVIVVMAKGENKFEIKYLTRRSFQKCAVASVEADGKIIHYQSLDPAEKDKKLIYKYDNFVEFNAAPKKYNLEKIQYRTSLCFGSCPEFQLTINADRSAVYNAVKYNKKDGKYKSTIEKQRFAELTDLLNYIDFPNLENDYSVNWTDDQTSVLTVTYDDGKTKQIKDYGLLGTFGLSALYDILFDLRENQTWH